MKTCQFCLPTRRVARYEITTQTTTGVAGSTVHACAKHTPFALYNLQGNATVLPLGEDGSYLFES